MQMYKKFRRTLRSQGLNKRERDYLIQEIQKNYEPLMESAEHTGKTKCAKRPAFLPIVAPLIEEYGFHFVKEGEDFFIYKA